MRPINSGEFRRASQRSCVYGKKILEKRANRQKFVTRALPKIDTVQDRPSLA
jgi:hypothetical protein